MKPWLLPSVVLLSLSAALLRADYTSTPLDAALTQQAPYKYAGIVVNDADSYRGSGAVVGNSRLVISCAHLPFNGNTLVWSTDNLWYRAYESSAPLTNAAGQVLRGYWKFDSYASMVSAHGQNSDEAFAKDFTAYYGYEDLGPGSARFWYDGQAALVSPASKIIVGYPSGNYAAGDSRQNMMHEAGPFPLTFTQILDGNYKIAAVTTGDGNSGGPVFVADESSLTDPDQGLRFAAVLLYGYDDISGGPIVGAGVLAVTSPEWDLVNSSLNAIGLAPLNDSSSAALKISGDTVTDTASNQYATKETGEPNHASNAGGHSIWWRWVAPGDGPVALNTQGSTCDTLLAVYTGSSVSSLTVVASNDDTGGTTSALNFTAAATTEYWIAADGKDGATGSITLNLSFVPPSAPANDVFANATAISGISAQVIGHNLNATKEPGEPDFTYNDGSGRTSVGGKSVWWKWTAPADGQVFLTTAGTSFDTLLSVYTGTAVNALTLVASDDDPPDTSNDSSTLTFPASGGSTYWISVSGWTNATHPAGSGAISLSLDLTPNFPVIVVQPSSQTPNIGDSVTLIVAARGAAPLTYQWYQNGAAISGATSATYRINSSHTSDAGNYTVVVTNNNGSVTSNIATLTVHGYPVISAQPTSQVVSAGNAATFTVVATSDTPFTYQWMKDGANLADGARISGSTSATLTILTAQTSDTGSYTVVVTNTTGSVTSLAVTLAVIPVLSSGGIVSISAGGAYNLLVGSDGSLWAVGENTYGQLGDGTFTFRNRPEQVAAGVVAAFAGGSHSLFLKSDGSMWGMGNDTAGQLGDGKGYGFQASSIRIATGVVAASAGANHSLFIKSDGTLWAMGDNAYGQLGDGTLTNRIGPEQVASGIVATSAGQTHSLFIKSDGTLWATGDNSFGQLGDGTTTARQTPVQVATGVVAASAGSGYSLFLKSDGSLWAAGENTSGQLGDGTSINRATPVQVANAVTAVAAGGDHCLFLKSDSTLWGMGSNTSGQLGLGSNPFSYSDYRNTPVQVTGGVVAASAGQSHSLYLGSDGTVWAMGNNYYGQLGDGTNTNRSLPVPVIGGTAEVPGAPVGATASAGTVVNAVLLTWNPTIGAAHYEIWRSSSNDFSGATLLASNVTSAIYYDLTVTVGTTYFYWIKAANQIGAGGASDASSGYGVPWIAPAIVTQATDQTVNPGEQTSFTVAAAGDPAPAFQWQRLPSGGSVWSDLGASTTYVGVNAATLTVNGPTYAMNGDQFRCVASNTGGQGISTAATLTVNALAGGMGVAAGSNHSLFVRADGALWGMGYNYDGELEDSTQLAPSSPVLLANGVVAASAGANYSLTIRSDGTLWAMGTNNYGELGDGTTTNRSTPVQVASAVAMTSAGGLHSLFVKADGTLWGMGSNGSGELGDGTTVSHTSPIQIASGVISAAAGGSHSLFLKVDGSLWAMGYNGDGQLGDSTVATRLSPTPIAYGVVTIAAGMNHSLFVEQDGTLWAMGNNNYGELGDGTLLNRWNPVKVADGVIAVTAGYGYSLFLKSDGTLWGMGENECGQLGDGTTTTRTSPVQITTDVTAVSAGEAHALFTKGDGTLWAMGFNSFGQLGDGTYANRLSPVQVGGGLGILPATPASITASDGTVPRAVQLAWSPVIGANHYEVWRNTADSSSAAVLVAGHVGSPLYGDFTATPGVTYFYWVKAVNFAGTSDFSASASGLLPLIAPLITTQPTGQPMISGQTAVFTIVADGSPAPAYQWQDSFDGGADWSALTDGAMYTGTSTAALTVTGVSIDLRDNQFRCVVSNGAGSSNSTPVTLSVEPGLVVTTLAGRAGTTGSMDGNGSAAEFYNPRGVAVDRRGNLYVADAYNHLIRKITPDGGVSTIAGLAGYSGNTDGSGSAARFNTPSGIAVDDAYNVYVADTFNGTIRKITSAGVVTTMAGAAGYLGSADGTGSAARFSIPWGIAVGETGNVYVADAGNRTIRIITPAGAVTTLAGLAGNSGSADGTGSAAQFDNPEGITVDSAGNVYVADRENYLIRKITPAGVVTTLAGLARNSGSADGTGSAARFNEPDGVAIDNVGDVYVADANNATVRMITPAGVVTTIAGLASNWGSADGIGAAARLNSPQGIAISRNGVIYLADYISTIRRCVIDGTPLFTAQPSDLAVMVGQKVSFTVEATDTRALSYQWQQSADGGSTWINLNSDNTYSGVTSATLTVTPASAAMTGDQFRCVVTNSLALGATSYAAILTVQIVPPVPTTDPAAVVIAGGFSAAWNAVGGATGYRLDVSSDSLFSSYVSGYQDLDLGNVTTKNITGLNPNTIYYYRIRAYNGTGTSANSGAVTVTTSATVVIAAPLTVSTLAGQPLSNGSADGTGTSARFYYPSGAAVDNTGNLYIADTDNDTIRKVAVSTGTVTTLAGLAGNSGNADGTGSAARFNNPSAVTVDGAGNVYVADTLNHTLRKITSQGVVSTLAGATGSSGSADGTGSTAQFQGPQGLAIDSASNLYVADTNNHTIRKVVLSTGAVTTVAGLAGNSGSVDGLGSLARFNFPSGVAVDGAGNLYVADTENHTIREISPSGLVNTLAGLAGNSGGADGTGTATRFDSPSAVAVDLAGNVYVTDTDNHTVRKVVPATGSVSTLAGLAGTSGSADGVGTVVRFFALAGIAVDSNSNLYMADTNNDTIRLGLLATMPSIQTQPLSQTVTAGSSVQFSVTASGRPALTYQWSFNNSAISGATGSSYSLASAQSGNAGNYTVTVANTVGSVTSNQAALTVNAATPPPSGGGSGGDSAGGGGAGGGGAPSWWFFGVLLLFAAGRGLRAARRR